MVDFLCVEVNLVIEVDGPTYDDAARAYDLARQAHLESIGLTVLRFYNGDVYDNMDGVLEQIAEIAEDKKGQKPGGSGLTLVGGTDPTLPSPILREGSGHSNRRPFPILRERS